MEKSILQISDLCVKYGKDTILDKFNLELNTGEILCILGHNGSGKSTLLNTIHGILPVTNGTINFEGEIINDLTVKQRVNLGIGYLPQDNNLFKHLRVKQHLELAATMNKTQNYDEIRQLVKQYIPTFDSIEDKRAGQLSGGERRKLGFAMLLAQGADKLWLLDEPSAGVDNKGIYEILEFLHYIKNEGLIMILLVEQNRTVGLKVADRILVIM